MYDNTYVIGYVFFAWLADGIRKISGRKTDSLINMAVSAF